MLSQLEGRYGRKKGTIGGYAATRGKAVSRAVSRRTEFIADCGFAHVICRGRAFAGHSTDYSPEQESSTAWTSWTRRAFTGT
jgi:hypothetical protein